MSTAKVIFLMGATATGKTDLAIEIGARFPVEIISVDSALIYRGMDIGTAKPGVELRARVPHHLIDIIDPAEQYSVWDFVEHSRELVEQIEARGRIPLLVGGSMLYYHAFERGLNPLPEADAELRRRLDREAQQFGWPAMHARLAEVDPDSAARIEPADAQRIQRALEVHAASGETMSRLQRRETDGFAGEIHKIILAADDRKLLHRRISARFHAMLEHGFLEEVAELRARGDLHPGMPSMRCVGYRQLWQFLDGGLAREEMIEKGIAATRQLAKRQITWLRKQPAERCFDCLKYSKDAIFRLVEAANLSS